MRVNSFFLLLTFATSTFAQNPVDFNQHIGFGSVTRGGEGGEVCTVTSLKSTGKGTLHACLHNGRNDFSNRTPKGDSFVPLRVEFAVAGEIILDENISIRTPYITIDGATAPPPGITIKKKDLGLPQKENFTQGRIALNTSKTGHSAHDIIIRHLRFDGGFDKSTQDHSQNSATLNLDGSDHEPGIYNIVLEHNTLVRSTDSGPDIYGNAYHITYQDNLIINSLHPTTISFYNNEQARNFITLARNVYAYNHERNPQIRGRVKYLEYVNNVVFEWGQAAGGGGYGVRIRAKKDVYPEKINLIGNYFFSNTRPRHGLMYADDNGRPLSRIPNIYLADNVLGPFNYSVQSSLAEPFVVDSNDKSLQGRYNPNFTPTPILSLDTLRQQALPQVGMKYRNAEEQAIIDRIEAQMSADSP